MFLARLIIGCEGEAEAEAVFNSLFLVPIIVSFYLRFRKLSSIGVLLNFLNLVEPRKTEI